jgi:cell division protein FtsQ
MIRKVLNILLFITIPAALFMLLGFAVEQNRRLPCSQLLINIDYRCGHHFIKPEEVRAKVLNSTSEIEGQPLVEGKLRKIESVVKGIPYVQKASVFRNINGELHIKVIQRQPLLRVVNAHNQSYYIDQAGRMMPVSQDYTARVLIATGHIHAGYSPLTDLVEPKDPGEISSNEQRLRDLYRLASFIEKDPFWNAFIDHVYVTASGQFELTPKNGVHIVEFGGIDQMEYKFKKLMVFYQNGLTRTGWNHYRRVNVKYSNQVICSK